METVGAFDAKTRLSELLARAAHGETFVITKHGRPVARLVPEAGHERERIEAALDRLRSLRGMIKSTSMQDVLDARHEGHRF